MSGKAVEFSFDRYEGKRGKELILFMCLASCSQSVPEGSSS